MSTFQKLPEWVHRIKIRFYKQLYPVADEVVMANINSQIEGSEGYYMNLIDYHNKEGLIVSKELSRSTRKKVLNQVFNHNNNYPLQVIHIRHNKDKEDIKTPETEPEPETEPNIADIEDIEDIESDIEEDTEVKLTFNEMTNDNPDDSYLKDSETTIELSNKNLDEQEKASYTDWHGKYKIIHTILHDFGYQLKQWEINNLDHHEEIDIDKYKAYLESLALKTIWKYSRNSIIDIIQQIRDDESKIDQYFELSPIEKKMFIKCIKHHITQTQYSLNCNFTLQSLSLTGLEVIKNILAQFENAKFKVLVVSPPNYSLKMESNISDNIKTIFNETREKINKIASSNYSKIKYDICEITNNKNQPSIIL